VRALLAADPAAVSERQLRAFLAGKGVRRCRGRTPGEPGLAAAPDARDSTPRRLHGVEVYEVRP
jgi:hypothetical protein